MPSTADGSVYEETTKRTRGLARKLTCSVVSIGTLCPVPFFVLRRQENPCRYYRLVSYLKFVVIVQSAHTCTRLSERCVLLASRQFSVYRRGAHAGARNIIPAGRGATCIMSLESAQRQGAINSVCYLCVGSRPPGRCLSSWVLTPIGLFYWLVHFAHSQGARGTIPRCLQSTQDACSYGQSWKIYRTPVCFATVLVSSARLFCLNLRAIQKSPKA